MRLLLWIYRIVLWCNGSTTVFGSVCPGSNPGKTTEENLNSLIYNELRFSFLLVDCIDFVILYAVSGFTVYEVDSD